MKVYQKGEVNRKF